MLAQNKRLLTRLVARQLRAKAAVEACRVLNRPHDVVGQVQAAQVCLVAETELEIATQLLNRALKLVVECEVKRGEEPWY